MTRVLAQGSLKVRGLSCQHCIRWHSQHAVAPYPASMILSQLAPIWTCLFILLLELHRSRGLFCALLWPYPKIVPSLEQLLYLFPGTAVAEYHRPDGSNNRNLFLASLEASSPRSRCRQGGFLRSLSPWPHRRLPGCLLPGSSHGLSSVHICV